MNTESYDLSDVPAEGHYDSFSQYWLIRKSDEFEEKKEIDFLEIGGPGVDGIGFGIRKGKNGIWAYYPIDNDFELKAESIEELIEGWKSGRIKV